MIGGSRTMATVLEEHLRASGLPPDAGNTQRFAVVDVGLLPYPIPNTCAGSVPSAFTT